MSAEPRTAWCLARILAGHTLNGEIARVEDRYRPIAARLNGMAAGVRQAAFKGACGFLDPADEAALTKALADADPDGPEPDEPAPAAPEPWPAMRLDELPAVPEFPVDVLPPEAADLVAAASRSIGCRPDLVAAPILGAASIAVGRSVSMLIKPGYFASAALYVCTVDRPSSGKSPALKAALRPVSRIGQALRRDFKRSRKQWEADCQALKAGPGGKKAVPPPPPVLGHIVIDNATMEVIPHRLETSPRGLGMTKDELSGLMTGLNQHKGGKGNDRQSLLDIWSGFEINKDRVGSGGETVSIHCPHPFLAIVGGTQPDMLDVFLDAKGRADGLVERFLFVCPDTTKYPYFDTAGIPSHVEDAWALVIDRLWMRCMNIQADGSLAPHVAFMTDGAKGVMKRLLDAHVDEMNADDFPEHQTGLWGKFGEYAGRFALILALLRHASDPTADPLEVPDVDSRAVEDAWKLVAYFKAHALRARAIMSRGPATPEAATAKLIVAWVRDNALGSFTERDLKRARKIDDDARDKALARLVAMNVLRHEKPDPKVGRRSKVFEVNPELHCQNSSPTP